MQRQPSRPKEGQQYQEDEPKDAKASNQASSSSESVTTPADAARLKQLQAAALQLNLQEQGNKAHAFWSTQPVPQSQQDFVGEKGPIEPSRDPEKDIRQEPYPLPDGFEWCEIDIDDDAQIKDVYTLLNENYVEDDDAMFRFDYSIPFLKWALKPPGYRREWHVGVRVSSSKRLYGIITAVPATIHVYERHIPMVEINFLCVHKKLRTKRLAPVLIKEITRRVNLTGIFQAVYTAGVVLPSPVARCRYWHRSLNPKKLIEVSFSRLAKLMTMARTIKLYSLPEVTSTPGLRPAEPRDMERVTQLLNSYLSKYSIAPELSLQEVVHILTPQEDVVYSYVVEDPQTKEITDFVSFYCLPSTIIGNPKYKLLRAAYSFYNVPLKTPLINLLKDALILAKQKDFDVFNALDIMENANVFKELKFGIGDGNLQYYLFNWRCPEVPPAGVGLVLL
mmetsp:Transcript_21067/g.35157  ORF Transcript_21067/g.35157 Transcript_21067/m.35157 type:complete len:449 (+) Transcript_21067:48-1394(+)